MSKFNENAVKDRYGKAPASEEQALGYLKALKVIIGADGVVDPAEMEALRKGMKRLGASAELTQSIEDFDAQGVSLESVLPNLTSGGKRARLLIRDAIELASADGTYAKEEKAAVHSAASLLGVDDATVRSLQSLVELEHAVKRLRKALL